MTSNFYDFVERFRIEAEKAIKAELSRRSILERAGIWFYMPLTVNVVTNQGSVSLVFLKDGSVQRRKYLSSSPDNVIQADFETLKELYSSRDKNQFVRAEREGKIRITSKGWKGQQAERKIRELLGC